MYFTEAGIAPNKDGNISCPFFLYCTVNVRGGFKSRDLEESAIVK